MKRYGLSATVRWDPVIGKVGHQISGVSATNRDVDRQYGMPLSDAACPSGSDGTEGTHACRPSKCKASTGADTRHARYR